MDMSNDYMVSVRLMTFNHAEFIAQAMEGILMQQTNFKVEVVVGDDFSTDNTSEIIKKFKDTNNIHIKILNRNIGDEYWKKRQKLGRLYNFKNILENCTGKYIALLDGDDYWTDPLKLQKQVDLLESNSNIVASFSNAITENEILGFKKLFVKNLDQGIVSKKNIILRGGGLFPTASFMFNNEILKNGNFYKILTFNGMYGDEALLMLLMEKGPIYYDKDVSSVYRVWSGSTYSSIQHQSDKIVELKKRSIINYKMFSNIINKKYSRLFKKKISMDSLYIFLHDKSSKRFNYITNIYPIDFLKYYYNKIKLKFS